MNRTLAFTFVLILYVLPSFAGNGSEIIYTSSPEYQLAEFARIASGKTAPGSVHAMTRREFGSRMLGGYTEKNDGFITAWNLKLLPYAGVFRSPYTGKEEYLPTPMIYLYDKMPDLADVTLAAGIDDSFYAKIVYNVSCSKKSIAGGTGFFQPAASDTYSSGDAPTEGYLSVSGNHYSVTAGRFKGGVGHGLMGNLFLNGQAPYYDQLQFTFYGSSLKYYYMLGSSSAKLSKEEYNIQCHESGGNYSPEGSGATTYITDSIKMFAVHRLEFACADNLTIGVDELSTVGGKSPDWSMINPVGIYHDAYDNRYHGYYFGADISYVPAEGSMIFAEILSDQVKLKGEQNDAPTALGWQIGYWYILPLTTQAKHRLALEASHLDTWTYLNKAPYLCMYQRRVQRVVAADVPLGYSQGGDCEQLSLMYTVVSGSGLKMDFTLSRLHKGEAGFEVVGKGETSYLPYAKAKGYDRGPSGIYEKWSTVECSLDIPLTGMLALNVLGHYSYIEDFNHQKGSRKHLLIFTTGVSIEI
jgi:hypothetical protein